MSSQGNDFLTQYKTISSKLKKRFLRKPNIAEASEQFSSLAKQQQQQECPHYAGFSCLALARCEQCIGNTSGEAQALLDASRHFLEAEIQNIDLQCPSFDEHLTAAISCYNNAIKLHIDHERAGLAASLCLEVGNAFKKLERPTEAIPYYKKASELLTWNLYENLYTQDLTASCYIEIGDYDSALVLLTSISQVIQEQCDTSSLGTSKPTGIFGELLAKCEVTRVLLLLLLQPSHHRLQPENASLMEKYAWESTDTETSGAYIMQDLFLLMQSIVMAHQSCDLESLKVLQVDLWSLLAAQQNDLLEEIINQVSSKTT